jgi:hypothetical protein
MNVKFVCLANSRKLFGRCVAGLRTDGSGWIRLVSDLPNGTLYTTHYILNNGSEAALLDIIEANISAPKPERYQPENWVLLEKQKWQLRDKIEPLEAYQFLKPYLDYSSNLFGNALDNIPYVEDQMNVVPASLVLIEPSNVLWHIVYFEKKRKTRVVFQLGRVKYDLGITDPRWTLRLSKLGAGIHPREVGNIEKNDKLLFTVSLGLPFDGKCYKLVAGIIHLPH